MSYRVHSADGWLWRRIPKRNAWANPKVTKEVLRKRTRDAMRRLRARQKNRERLNDVSVFRLPETRDEMIRAIYLHEVYRPLVPISVTRNRP